MLRNAEKYLPITHHRATETAAGEVQCEGGNWTYLAQDRIP